MKKKILVAFLFIGFASLSIVLLSSCNNSTEPKKSQRLIIEDGYYSKVESNTSSEILYAIEFIYYVKGEECNWGGYHIKMDSQEWMLDLYQMQLLIPDEKHSIIDTFKVTNELKTNPVVDMQGYKVGSSESNESLKAVYTLKPKS
ncbi:MAG: hypothetical protein AB1432_16330 [Bacteroidota bacterium]